MAGLEKPFPDMEKALILGIPVALAAVGSAGVTAADSVPGEAALTPKLSAGFVRVVLVNDPDDAFTRVALVDVDVFASTRAVAYDVAQKVRGIVLASRGMNGVVFDRTSTDSGPKRVPWDDSSTIRRFLATYRISTRR